MFIPTPVGMHIHTRRCLTLTTLWGTYLFPSLLLISPFIPQTARAEQAAETDMHSEYARQREHLERSVASLRKKLSKDTEIHRADNIRVMQVRDSHVLHMGCVLHE